MLSVKNIVFCFFKKKDNLKHTQMIFSYDKMNESD